MSVPFEPILPPPSVPPLDDRPPGSDPIPGEEPLPDPGPDQGAASIIRTSHSKTYCNDVREYSEMRT
jgi:hypothetical protein